MTEDSRVGGEGSTIIVASAHGRLCEGFRMPAPHEPIHAHGGRRPKTSKGGNRDSGGWWCDERIPTLLGLTCGLRRGEICALRWNSVDLDRGQLVVVKNRAGTAWPSSNAITMDIYSHVMPNMQREAVDRVDEALQQALQKRAAKPTG
jgi:hypothetical protein